MTAPLPKCPKHHVFMRYHSGEHPERWVFCPECNDYYREAGDTWGRTVVRPAFDHRS